MLQDRRNESAVFDGLLTAAGAIAAGPGSSLWRVANLLGVAGLRKHVEPGALGLAR
jgi:hypothetical protein